MPQINQASQLWQNIERDEPGEIYTVSFESPSYHALADALRVFQRR